MNTQLELRPHYGMVTEKISCGNMYDALYSDLTDPYSFDVNDDFLNTLMDLQSQSAVYFVDPTQTSNGDYKEAIEPKEINIREPDYEDFSDYVYWANFDETADEYPCSIEFIRSMRKFDSDVEEEYSDEPEQEENNVEVTNDISDEENMLMKQSRIYDYM